MAEKLAKAIAKAIDNKKGENIVILDLRKISGAICDYFVICNANSTVQVGAIASGVEDDVLKELKEKPYRINGQENAMWIAMDYGNVMVHIFLTEMRDYYKLDELWGDAPIERY